MTAVLPSGVPARPSTASLAPDRRCVLERRAAGGRAALGTSPGAVAVAAAVLAQGIALARLDGGGGWPVAVGAGLALLCAAAWAHRRRLGRADVLIATAAFGGLGMMAGEWIARAVAPPAHHGGMHHGAMHAAPSAASWVVAAGVMLLTCTVACRWTCAPLCRGRWARRLLAHALAAGGMVGGMAAADALLTPLLVRILGAAAGMHTAMVLGMTVGVAAALPVVAWVGTRAPRAPHASAVDGAEDLSGTCPAG